MSKKEIYYKFIFPLYENLQTNQVKTLCNSCPNNVYTYERLPSRIKGYIDEYLEKPKYFNLRVYADDTAGDIYDAQQRQFAGVSLMVSSTPEVSNVEYDCWIKFTANDGKTVYCSVVVGSGMDTTPDTAFFYNFNLPDEVLKKSNLRNTILTSQFHKNWYIRTSPNEWDEYYNYYSPAVGRQSNPIAGREKRVFDPHYFFQGNVVPVGKHWITTTNNQTGETTEILVDLHTDPNDQAYTNPDHIEYKEAYSNTDPDPKVGQQIYDTRPIRWPNDIPLPVHGSTLGETARIQAAANAVLYKNTQAIALNSKGWSVGQFIGLPWASTRKDISSYDNEMEDVKFDFIDLEVTRRILYPYYNNWTASIPQIEIPTIVSGIGKSTILSYEAPQEYIDYPPMPINYKLLRDTLNGIDPYGDCETVLVMWVADHDPMTVSDGNITGLRSLNWEQYAVPISVRCCFKDGGYCTHRFKFLYPNRYNPAGTETTEEFPFSYRFHTRRCSAYDKNSFKEALYLPDLIEYSNDYIVVYHNKSFDSNSSYLNIQQFLYQQHPELFKALYIRKHYHNSSYRQQQQSYYILVDDSKYDKSENYPTIFRKKNTNNSTIFKPSECILSTDYEDRWNLKDSPWIDTSIAESNQWHQYSINDNIFIALFKVPNSSNNIKTKSGKLSLSNTLYQTYGEDIYISSIGFSTGHNWSKSDALMYSIGDATWPGYPLDLLDGKISINNITYGHNTGNGTFIGFKNIYDYSHNDNHHFKFIGNEYKLVHEVTNINGSSSYELADESENNYTIYVYVIEE